MNEHTLSSGLSLCLIQDLMHHLQPPINNEYLSEPTAYSQVWVHTDFLGDSEHDCYDHSGLGFHDGGSIVLRFR